MSGHCCPSAQTDSTDPSFRRVLWFALVINAGMFVVEVVASSIGDSVSLQADALDFFSDAGNYAISLFVVGSTVLVRARASIFKAASMGALGLFVIASTSYRAMYGSAPEPMTMGVIGTLALVANVVVAITLYRFRTGDSNMRSIWLCSRNDAIGNLAVIIAAAGVFSSATRWPDLIVACVIATLAISSAWQIYKLARKEIDDDRAGCEAAH